MNSPENAIKNLKLQGGLSHPGMLQEHRRLLPVLGEGEVRPGKQRADIKNPKGLLQSRKGSLLGKALLPQGEVIRPR